MHWSSKYLQLSRMHCWDFVRKIQKEEFGNDLPEIMVSQLSIRTVLHEFRANTEEVAEKYGWDIVDNPEEGDVVIMGHSRDGAHIGVWAGPGVLHCEINQRARIDHPDMLIYRKVWYLRKK